MTPFSGPETLRMLLEDRPCLNQEGKNSLKMKFVGQDIPGTSGTQTSGYPGQKRYASGLFLCCFRRSVRDVRDLGRDPGFGKNFMQENFGLIFSSLLN